jgi:hypothetical protein
VRFNIFEPFAFNITAKMAQKANKKHEKASFGEYFGYFGEYFG